MTMTKILKPATVETLALGSVGKSTPRLLNGMENLGKGEKHAGQRTVVAYA